MSTPSTRKAAPKSTTPATAGASSPLTRARAARTPVDPNETAEAKFRRIATRRLRVVVKSLRGLETVAKGAAYSFTAEQGTALMKHIDTAVDALRVAVVRRVNGKAAEAEIKL